MTRFLPLPAPLVRGVDRLAQSATCLLLGHDWTLWSSSTELLTVCDRCEAERSTPVPFEV